MPETAPYAYSMASHPYFQKHQKAGSRTDVPKRAHVPVIEPCRSDASEEPSVKTDDGVTLPPADQSVALTAPGLRRQLSDARRSLSSCPLWKLVSDLDR